MDKFSLELISQKINSPGFYDGIVLANKIFAFRSLDDIINDWRFVKVYLQCYEVPSLNLTDEGVDLKNIRPFQTEDDIEIANM